MASHVIPAFSYENPNTWFSMLEASWLCRTELTDVTKFATVVANIPVSLGVQISDVIANPPDSEKYETVKTAILKTLTKTREQYIQEIDAMTLAGRCPSELWKQLCRANIQAGTPYPSDVLRYRFTRLLPEEILVHLACAPKGMSDDDYAQMADRVAEAQRKSRSAYVNNVSNYEEPTLPLEISKISSQQTAPPPSVETCREMDELSARLAKIEESLHKLSTTTSHAHGQLRPPLRQENDATGLCVYHDRFGEFAYNCRPPCKLSTTTSHAHGQLRPPLRQENDATGLCVYHERFGEFAYNCRPPCKLSTTTSHSHGQVEPPPRQENCRPPCSWPAPSGNGVRGGRRRY